MTSGQPSGADAERGRRIQYAGATAAVLVLVAILAGWPTPAGLVTGVAVLAIVLCATVDLVEMRIPNVVTYSGTAFVLGAGAVAGLDVLGDAVLGAAIGGGILGVMSLISRGQVGLGDAKLSVLGGSLVGGTYVLPALLIGTLSAVPIFLGLLLLRRIHRRQAMPYGPYLSLGFVVVTLVAGSVFTR
jgi:leader peptidase (prepilin peptidase)/N-methyltransferase